MKHKTEARTPEKIPAPRFVHIFGFSHFFSFSTSISIIIVEGKVLCRSLLNRNTILSCIRPGMLSEAAEQTNLSPICYSEDKGALAGQTMPTQLLSYV